MSLWFYCGNNFHESKSLVFSINLPLPHDGDIRHRETTTTSLHHGRLQHPSSPLIPRNHQNPTSSQHSHLDSTNDNSDSFVISVTSLHIKFCYNNHLSIQLLPHHTGDPSHACTATAAPSDYLHSGDPFFLLLSVLFCCFNSGWRKELLMGIIETFEKKR
ncbi:unnamed protein product [Vicia faba]|uniref:Uncharacterized protein n=1 Tax=Vicia faba TaxID=3906 RepID=A0AAV1B6K1_VICFA|nr:unnamed protein product [Vicia faba]